MNQEKDTKYQDLLDALVIFIAHNHQAGELLDGFMQGYTMRDWLLAKRRARGGYPVTLGAEEIYMTELEETECRQ